MSDELREKIAEIVKNICQDMLSSICSRELHYRTINEAIGEIRALIQPDLTELSQYREMFEGLRVEKPVNEWDKCRNSDKHSWTGTTYDLEHSVAYCDVCKKTQKELITRPLTMEERKEFLNFLLTRVWLDYKLDKEGILLSSGGRVIKR